MKFQSTYVAMHKPAFSAPYSGTSSLSPNSEDSYSLSATGYLGLKVWQGGEIYFNPEMIMSRSMSNLTGLGGLANGEDQKGGGSTPTLYTARLFARQTLNLGGEKIQLGSAFNQMSGEVDSHRLVFTGGKISLIDIFDNNSYCHDPRTQFLNWSLMTHGGFDYAADQRGYTIGAAAEYYHDAWVARVGRFEQPIETNGLPLDPRIMLYHGDQAELEHSYEFSGLNGKWRLLVYQNRANMGAYQDALNYWISTGRVGIPNVDDPNVLRDQNKNGYGINLEQAVTPDVGVFFRLSRNDGNLETYAFTEIEQSTSGGVLAKGSAWGRPEDSLGIAYARNGLSATHQQYLANGGIGFFIGDGRLNYQPEGVLESFYNAGILKNIWLALDYQYITNPAYNADRGPVQIFGTRLHWEH